MVETRSRRRHRAASSLSLAALKEFAAARNIVLSPAVWQTLADVDTDVGADSRADADLDQRQLRPADLGAAYERYLTRDRTGRRGAGAYFTPTPLVRFVVELALAPLLATTDVACVRALRILDPCVGGGAFVLEIHRRLVERLVKLGADPDTAARDAVACVRGVDRDPMSVAVTKLALELAGSDGSAIEQADFLDAGQPSDVGYDAVIGNPPWGAKGYVFPQASAALRREYATARGVLDPCKLFVERAAKLVRPEGRIAFVLPDVVLLKGHPSFRRYLLETLEIDGIAHLGRCFPGVLVDAIVLSVVRRVAPSAHRVRLWDDPLDKSAFPSRPDATTPQSLFAKMPDARFNIYWSDAALATYERLLTHRRLADVFESHEGVHTGNARAKLFGATSATPGAQPVVVGGRELARYRLKWAGCYLDTRPEALDRPAGEYANLGRAQWFVRPKVVVRRTGDRLVAAVDEGGHYVSNNMFVLLPRESLTEPLAESASDPLDTLWAACAILNSELLTWLFRAMEPRVGRLFAELKINHLARFPWPMADQAQTRRLADLARQVAQIASPGGGRGPGEAAAELLEAIDREVAALYGVVGALPPMRLAAGAQARQTR